MVYRISITIGGLSHTNNMENYLFAPGPVNTPRSVSLSMFNPALYHADKDFYAIMSEVYDGLKYIFRTSQNVLLLTGSGTLSMEQSVANLFSPGDSVIVCINGRYGENWKKICVSYGIDVFEIIPPEGVAVTASDVEEVIQRAPNVKGVLFQHVETTTGVLNPVKDISASIKEINPNILVVVDSVCGLINEPFEFDLWGVDCAVSASQKGLMLPPGLCFMALSARAIEHAKQSTFPKFYVDVVEEERRVNLNQTRFTPAIPTVMGLRLVLQEIKKLGIENIWKRQKLVGELFREAVRTNLHLDLFSYDPTSAVSIIVMPPNIKGQDFTDFLSDEYGITIGKGVDGLKESIVRIAHLGYDFNPFNLLIGIAGIERGLNYFNKYFGADHKFVFGEATRFVLERLPIGR